MHMDINRLQCSSKMNIKKKIQENIVFKTLKQRSLINRVNTRQIYGLIRSVWKSFVHLQGDKDSDLDIDKH